MGSSSRHTRKRRPEGRDSSEEGRRSRNRRSRSHSRDRSESPKDKRSRKREKEPSPEKQNEEVESMSIEETNKMRAKLGLAPLEEDTPKIRDAGEGDGSKIVTEDGMEFRHKAPENLADKKRNQDIKEKLEVAKKRRQVYEKVIKAKNLADSDSDDDAAGWVEKLRKQEEEKKKAAEREKMLNELDAEFDVSGMIEDEKSKQAKAKNRAAAKQKRARGADTAGLVVGHSKEAFVGMTDQILVLDDKSVLDDGDETLVNPNLMENERHAKNVELKNRKNTNRGFDQDLDEYGNPRHFGVLAKYDEDIEGERQTFRLDEGGSFDLDKEKREAEIRRKLEMAGKTLVSMEMPKPKLGTDFYTQEEMISFRKPKKGKKEKKSMRKRGKMLKADDLIPDEPAGANLGSRDRGSRRRREEDGGDVKMEEEREEGEVGKEEGETDDGPVYEKTTGKAGLWKKATKGTVDVERLKALTAQYNSDEEDREDEFGGLEGIVIEDDAQDELSAILDKTRRLKQGDVKVEMDPAKKTQEMMSTHHQIKMEVDEGEAEGESADGEREGIVSFDSTREYCRNIGENLTYGLAGNRTDAIDVSELKQEREEEDSQAIAKWKEAQAEKERRARRRERKKESKGGWLEPGPSGQDNLDSDDERELEAARERMRDRDYSDSSSSEDEREESGKKREYENVLGKEADVTKGVGAMLKLASQKGYLADPNSSRHSGQNLDHLKNQSKTQIEAARYDIEDKYAKKLDRLGTTGRGPIVAFQEKKDYNPEVVIEYVDQKGRLMERKEAYRELSYKFHGRNPGKKQTEKRMIQMDKREKLKQMNSSDTPLGTLTKQLKKQEQLATPYLILSGTGRSDHTSIKKE